jgi:predicted neuraminidase
MTTVIIGAPANPWSDWAISSPPSLNVAMAPSIAFQRDVGLAPGRIQVSESQDHGETWSVARDTDLPNPGSSVAILTLADGRWLLVLNDTEHGRHQLAVMVSEDEGRTWPAKRYLEKAAPDEGRYGYPTAIQSRDGQVHVTYTHGVSAGNSINHVVIDPRQLPYTTSR